MAKAKTTRVQAKKLKDKWKAKEWYKIYAPEMFNRVLISETLADDVEKLKSRVSEVTMQEITGDFSKMHVKLRFKVDMVRGTDAHTRFIGQSLTSDYIRRLTKRKHSKMDGVYDIWTKDGFQLRVKPMAITEKRIQASKQKVIRAKIGEVIGTKAREFTLAEMVGDIVTGTMNSALISACKPIYPLNKVEIRKTEVLATPEMTPDLVAEFEKKLAEFETKRAEEEAQKKADEKAAEDARAQAAADAAKPADAAPAAAPAADAPKAPEKKE
jgi:small subunit ribosomal protein S3Ae